MLISKKSPRPSERFFTGPGEGHPDNFPLRRYLRLREDFGAGVAHAILVALLLVLVLVLGRTAAVLFRASPTGWSPWYGWAVWMLIAIFTLSVTRVLYYKFRDLRRMQLEMKQLRGMFRQSGIRDTAEDDPGQRHS